MKLIEKLRTLKDKMILLSIEEVSSSFETQLFEVGCDYIETKTKQESGIYFTTIPINRIVSVIVKA